MEIFKVLKSGLFSTIQDSGRTGYQNEGVVVSGAMDPFAHKISNILLGNNRNSASLEITMMGPTLQVLEDTVISICGANLSPKIDGKPVGKWKTLKIKKNQILSFGQPVNGIRAYISISGGFDVPEVLKSFSTYAKGKIGGFKGRTLKDGDILKANEPAKSKPGIGLSWEIIPNYDPNEPIRVILGPDTDRFTPNGIKTLLNSQYRITNAADRMGYRLDGPQIKHKNGADIISDAANIGTLQVPKDGKPIVLMSDHQTTGGYTRIANVISIDIPLIAQRYPGQSIFFKKISIEKAQSLHKQQIEFLDFLDPWLNN
jgi:antagonist of KipI